MSPVPSKSILVGSGTWGTAPWDAEKENVPAVVLKVKTKVDGVSANPGAWNNPVPLSSNAVLSWEKMDTVTKSIVTVPTVSKARMGSAAGKAAEPAPVKLKSLIVPCSPDGVSAIKFPLELET